MCVDHTHYMQAMKIRKYIEFESRFENKDVSLSTHNDNSRFRAACECVNVLLCVCTPNTILIFNPMCLCV